MALKRYETTVNGHRTTLLLSDEDAKLHGLSADSLAGKNAPTNKAAKPQNTKTPPRRGFFGKQAG